MTAVTSSRARTWLVDRGGVLALATLALYVALAPADIVGGDSAEYATLGVVGGVPHPPGHPLYLLWLRATTHLTSWIAATPAHRAAIATAVLGAAAVWTLHAACRAWGARPAAATLAAMLFATAPLALRLHTEPEAYALNDLIVAAILWLSATAGPARGLRRALLIGLAVGLGLANEPASALIAPVAILGIARGVREHAGHRTAALGAAITGVALGLTPYLLLLVEPARGAGWGSLSSLGELAAHARGAGYLGPAGIGVKPPEIPASAQLWSLAGSLAAAGRWLPALVGLAAFGWRAARPNPGESLWSWGLLAVGWLACGVLLVPRFAYEPTGVAHAVLERAYLMPALVLAVGVAAGFDVIAVQWRARVPAVRLSRAPAMAIAVVLFVALAAVSLPSLRRAHSPAEAQAIENLLMSLPPRAIVFVTPDDVVTGLEYAQVALGERPDVTAVAWPRLDRAWYVPRLVRAGLPMAALADVAPAKLVADAIAAVGRPVFSDPLVIPLLGSHATYPYGLVIRIVPRGAPEPSLDDVRAANVRLYTEVYQFGYALPSPGDGWAAEVHDRYAAAWYDIGEAFERAHRHDEALRAYGLGNQIGPQP